MRQRSPKEIWFLWLLAAALALQVAGVADELPASITIAGVGIRYEPQEGELCLTRDEIPQEALPLLGADEAMVHRAMEAGGLYLLILTADGRQVSLRVIRAPAVQLLTDPLLPGQPGPAFSLASPEEQLLHFLQRNGGFRSAAWLDHLPGFALLSTMESPGSDESTIPEHGKTEKNTDQTGLQTLSLATLHRNQIISFQTDIFGREPSQADEDLLIATAKRAVLPDGLSDGSGSLTLSPQAPLTDENIVFSYVLGTLPLEIIPIPAIVGSTSLTVSGRTAPRSSLKYTVNGQPSSRFKADAEGAFSVTLKNLIPDADNEITFFVSGDGSASTATGSVFVQWQPTPIILSQTAGTVQEDRITLQGITLPGTKLQLIRKLETVSITVQKDGSFTYSVLLKKIGENTFTIRALAQGYKRTEVEATFIRIAEAGNP